MHNTTSNWTTTTTDYNIVSEVKCPYKEKCVSYPNKCGSCRHNAAKRDYYQPINIPNYVITPCWTDHWGYADNYYQIDNWR